LIYQPTKANTMLVRTNAGAVQGIEATTITVEVSAGGLPESDEKKTTFYFLVGLPDSAIKEGWQRIEAALKNSFYKLPRVKLVVNLAPADLRKEGAAYDLPIALAVYAASNNLEFKELANYVIMGELSLDGSVRPIKGALPIAIQTHKEKFSGLILPKANAREAAIVSGLTVYGIEHISEAIAFLPKANLWNAL
jgi:magnesium chelatase family protein